MTALRQRVVALLGIVLTVAACPGGPTAPPAVATVSMSVSNFTPRVGDVIYVTAVGENAQGVSVGVKCTYMSQFAGIASVDANTGAVTANSVGTTVITATCGNKTGTASITVLPPEVTLTVAIQGNGAVQYLPSSSSGVLYVYDQGTAVRLTAIPSAGSAFVDWVGGPCNGSSNPVCTFTINASTSFTAVFGVCANGYCGTISVPSISLYYTRAGFGYNWTGSVTLQFSPLPPPLTIRVYYFTFDISGTANTNTSSTTLVIPLSGSSVACALANGTLLNVENLANPNPLMASVPITWTTPGCP